MKKYLFLFFILINYSVTFAETSENPLINLVGDIAGGAIEMALKMFLFFIFPILLIYFIILYFIKR